MEPIWIVAAVVAGGLLVILLLRFGRGRERVIDVGGPATAEPDAPARTSATAKGGADDDAMSAGELLEAKGRDEGECGLADWLMEDVNDTLGGGYLSDRMIMTRVADVAIKVSADLKATGRASVELPFIAADASGPKHYKRDVTRQEAELGMVEHGALLVDELLQWRGRDARVVKLGGWLEAESDEDAGSGSLDPLGTVRVADATEKAMADIAATGRAIVDLPRLSREGGAAYDFRREFDRAALEGMLSDA